MSTFSYVGKHEFAKPSALVSKSVLGAAFEGNIEELQKCLSAGEKMDQWDEKGQTPLHYAVKYGQVESVTFLLKEGADRNRPCELGRTPLHYAARYGQKAAAEALCALGAPGAIKVDAQDKSMWTALHIAAEQGHADVIAVLCKHKAHVNKPIEGTTWTPLLLAADKANTEAVQALLKAGADATVLVGGKFAVIDIAGRFSSEKARAAVTTILEAKAPV
mmetsp:Transcript_41684/g.69636  ORF Transcript_41684/g.69636 Transcript_41684/m.69636 type:complete len:219 (-) Transcript_41684:220-876(-)|eukprot:CAMPEP_0198215054 /NCGR_PEP_ID=MMETSP1445-20131203/46534_1 /TAXON_ID=36898 /ORGANISM="Pyramimonas sp., Strain CCMP2087" /LENGTH=218 /DNA_ID=CAMNT_0043890569 /DNA_START=69 /DNA_END=725 /DNA_ORIENTATION=+